MQDSNPFAPPGAASLPEQARDHWGEASQGQRLGNLLLDYVGFMGLSLAVGVVSAVFDVSDEVLNAVPDQVFGMGIMVTYYLGCEATMGRTLGKWVTGTKVIDEMGKTPHPGRILLRTVVRFVPFEAFSFLSSGSGWHDKWSKTRVVRVRPTKWQREAAQEAARQA